MHTEDTIDWQHICRLLRMDQQRPCEHLTLSSLYLLPDQKLWAVMIKLNVC